MKKFVLFVYHRRMALLALIVLFLFGLGVFHSLLLVNWTSGSGDKVGQIVKLARVGFLHKTWEAELIKGGMSNGSGSFGTTPFHFTVESDEQAESVRKLMNEQAEVIIHYRTERVYSTFRSDSGGDFLESIEPLKK